MFMNTTDFLKPIDLAMKERDYTTLLHVLDKLEKGEIEYHDIESHDDERGKRIKREGLAIKFNMNYTASRFDSTCGSICCIGGWMYALQNGQLMEDGTLEFDRIEADNYVYGTHRHIMDEESPNEGEFNLHSLFFPVLYDHDDDTPRGDRIGYGDIKPEHAVQAIRNYLTTNDPKWAEVMGLEPINDTSWMTAPSDGFVL